VTEAVCEEIKEEYVVEEGEGYKRDVYLKEHNIKSFFIVPDPKKQKESEVRILGVFFALILGVFNFAESPKFVKICTWKNQYPKVSPKKY